MWHCTKVFVRTAETTQCCAAGADLQRDEIVSTSGSDHRGFLETCAAKSVSYFIQFLMQGLAHMRLMIHFMCPRHLRAPAYPG